MRIKLYDKEQLIYFPLYPFTIDINYPQEKVVRPDGYTNHQIFTVSNGNGILKINNNCYCLSKGDMFYIGRNVPHEYWGTDKDFQTSYLSFFGNGFENMKKYYNIADFGVYRNKNIFPFESQLKKIFENFGKQYELSVVCVSALVTVTAFFDEACKKTYSPIESVYKYIENNYFQMITLEDILAFYPFSKSKLCHDFKREYKMTIFEKIMEIRLENARYMIKSNPNIKLSTVASSCGFNDTSYFCKMYKKSYGESPKNNN